MLKRSGVLGYPVAHSRSPQMHNAAYRALGMDDWHYQLLPVPPDLFDETVRALPQADFVGVNVTIPHKEAALALADVASDSATQIGAANTLTFRDGQIIADNTDAPGLLNTLPLPMQGKKALVLGAGGSARAMVWALVEQGADVRVWNRTPERAERICQQLGGRVVMAVEPTDLLVNCTSVGLKNPETTFDELPLQPSDLSQCKCVVDLVYGEEPTLLLAQARAAGVATVDGLDILVAQGALSFEIWTGVQPPLDTMRASAERG